MEWRNPLGKTIFERSYALRDSKGMIIETFEDSCKRIAIFGSKFSAQQKEMERLILEHKLVPGGRWWSNAGKEYPQINNCLAADTKIVTRKGIKTLKECAFQQIEVLNRYGKWETAKVEAFGIQQLYRIHLENGENIYATRDHRWWQSDGSRVTTLQLKEIPLVNPKELTKLDEEGIRHGIVFGDGYKHPHTRFCDIIFVNEKKDISLLKYFRQEEVTILVNGGAKRKYKKIRRVKAGMKVSFLPAHYKSLPTKCTPEYARGFIAGLIATDGHISKRGNSVISCEGIEKAKLIRDLATLAGCISTSISIISRVNPFNGEEREMCNIQFKTQTLPILLPSHLENSKTRTIKFGKKNIKVVSIDPNRYEEVMCVVAPKTESFTLANGLITSNCFVIPINEGLGKFCHDLCVTLMTGGGVGVNYSDIPHPATSTDTKMPFYPELFISKSHPDFNLLRAQYPHMIKENPEEGGKEIAVGFPVKDSREGWGVALLKTADGLQNCQEVVLNLSNIRPRGTPIKSLGGVSAGPESLILMIDGIFGSIMRCRLKKQTLGPIDWMRIANFVGRGVSAGGQRRSAQMAMLHWKHDSIDRFITCKDKDGDLEGMNVSVVIDNTFVKQAKNKGTRANKLFDRIIKHGCTHGEPGMWNIELAQQDVPDAIATNPCGEQSLPAYGNCNLGHINLAAHKSFEEIENTAKLLTEMLINGTLHSKFPLPEFYARVDKDRRIGVGILGLHSWLVQRGKSYILDKEDSIFFDKLYNIIRDHADKYAKKLRINKPQTVTTVAPTGTVAIMMGVSSGIEPMFCAAYKRTYYTGGPDQKLDAKVFVDPLAKECLEKKIPIQDSFSLTTDEHLAMQIKIQNTFVDNSVSKTINLPKVGSFNIANVKRAVLKALSKGIKGVTLYPDGARGNQPFQPVPLEEAIKLENEAQAAESACSTGSCNI